MKRRTEQLTPVSVIVRNGVSTKADISVKGNTFTLSGKIRLLDGK